MNADKFVRNFTRKNVNCTYYFIQFSLSASQDYPNIDYIIFKNEFRKVSLRKRFCSS